MLLPVTSTKSGAAYTILAGFQLTPDQMAQTRRRTRSRLMAVSPIHRGEDGKLHVAWLPSTAWSTDFSRLRSS